jgi:hypothetical protein
MHVTKCRVKAESLTLRDFYQRSSALPFLSGSERGAQRLASLFSSKGFQRMREKKYYKKKWLCRMLFKLDFFAAFFSASA